MVGRANRACLPSSAADGYRRASMVPRERVKRECRASRAGLVVRGQAGGCSRNCQRRAAGPSTFRKGGPLDPTRFGKVGQKL
jgi:hypothetical protein